MWTLLAQTETVPTSWLDPETWMRLADRFGVAVLVIFVGGFFLACIGFAIYLAAKRIYKDFSPVIQAKIGEVAASHRRFTDTAADTMKIHADANASHAQTHALNAASFAAITEAVEDGIDNHKGKLSDLVRVVYGSLEAANEALEELEIIYKDDPARLRAVARTRVRLAGLKRTA